MTAQVRYERHVKWLRAFLQRPQQVIAAVALIGFLVDLAIKPISNAGLILIVLALSPWITRIIKTIELPGGGKVEFERELAAVSDKVENAGFLAEPPTPEAKKAAYEAVFHQDPTLALAGLRIELERRINRLVALTGCYSGTDTLRPMPLNRAVSALASANVISREELSALQDVIPLLNKAVHSVEFSMSAAEWAMDFGPRMLAAFDEKIARLEGGQAHWE
ncbi:MAG: hypothetical protein ACM3Q1_00730 [Bacteroidales bacterium]